jgi:hypothetical protein
MLDIITTFITLPSADELRRETAVVNENIQQVDRKNIFIPMVYILKKQKLTE